MNAAEKHRRRARRKAKGVTLKQKGAGLSIQNQQRRPQVVTDELGK